jgi:hypothetical protein
MGSHVFILNSIKAAHDLLDKRSAVYSDRYRFRDRTARLYRMLILHAL